MGSIPLFLASVALLAAGSFAAASCARSGPARFWVAITAALAQLWAACLIASLASAYTRPGVLIVQAFAAAALIVSAWRIRRSRESPPAREAASTGSAPSRRALDAPTIAALLVAGALIALSGARQWLTPLGGIDELNYHASRALYWIQNHSVFPYETHNERQTALPFAAEMLFSWAILFMRSEAVGRVVHWLALPLSAAGVFIVARQVGARRAAAAVGVLVYAATPAVLRISLGLKSDAWTPLLALGTAYWALRAHAGQRPALSFFAAGLTLAFAAAVKTTLLAMAPGLLLIALLAGSARRAATAAAWTSAGAVAGAAISGLAVLLIANTLSYAHPLGPANLRQLVQPQGGAKTRLVHAARVPVYLLELPSIPSEPVRRALERTKQQLARAVGADRALPGERETGWPAPFRTCLPPLSTAYSLPGVLWVPGLVAGLAATALQTVRGWPRVRLSPTTSLILLQAPLLLGVVLLLRWMGNGPDRFWLPAYALFVPALAAGADGWARRAGSVAAVALIAVAYTAWPALRESVRDVRSVAAGIWYIDGRHGSEYAQAAEAIGVEARVLLVGLTVSADYLLFARDAAYGNRVIAWGQHDFQPARAEAVLAAHDITHALVATPRRLRFFSGTTIHSAPAIEWFASRSDFQPVPIEDVGYRLFRRVAASPDRGGIDAASPAR